MTSRVSAIIVVLNGERFIADAIESVLAQEGAPLELLVVDDGSSDRTVEIVRSFGDRARLLAHPGGANLGMSASRNLGVSEARGKYVAFLDSDDVWLPGKIAAQTAILDEEPGTAMVYGRTMIWHSWDPRSERPDSFYDLGVRGDRTYPAGAMFPQLLANRFQSPTTCNAMIRRDALLAVDGFEPTLRGMFEDQLLFAKLLLRYPVHVESACSARYRQHEHSASAAVVGDGLSVPRLQRQYLHALRRYIVGSGGAGLRERAALEWTIARLTARIAARRTRRALRRSRA